MLVHPRHRSTPPGLPRCAMLAAVLLLVAGGGGLRPARAASPPPSGPAARSVDAWIAWWRRDLPADRYRFTADQARGLVIASTLPASAHEAAVAAAADAHDAAARLLGDPPPTYAVLVAILDPADGRLIRGDHAGPSGGGATGIYVHVERRALVRDIGRSLRHEVAHAVHYRDMERRGLRRPDPLWFQEGFATLAEEIRLDDDGTPTLVPGRRLELARRRVVAVGQLSWRRLSPEAFARRAPSPRDAEPRRPLAELRRFLSAGEGGYVDAMAIAARVLVEDRFDAWLLAIAESAGPESPSDPIAALVPAFSEPTGDPARLSDLERAHRRWLLDHETVPIEPDATAGRLGILLDEDRRPPDGHLVADVPPGLPAGRSGVRAGDVLVAVGGSPVAGSVCLDAALARLAPGSDVAITVRRGDERVELQVTPAKAAPSGLGRDRSRI